MIHERIVDGDASKGEFHILKTQDCEPMFEAIKALGDNAIRKINTQHGRKYLGSVPNLLAINWAKEWGVRPFSKEWTEKAKHRLKHDPDWNLLRARQTYRY